MVHRSRARVVEHLDLDRDYEQHQRFHPENHQESEAAQHHALEERGAGRDAEGHQCDERNPS